VIRSRRLLFVALAAVVSLSLAGGGAMAQEDEASAEAIPPMASMAPMGSMAPMESMAPGLTIHDPWARESMMAELAGAAFMVIHNSTGFDEALVGASSPAAAVVEIHQTTMAEDGTMGMAPVAEVPIPAGGDAVLEPGGYHVMLIDLVGPLEVGQVIEVELEFRTAAPQAISLPVRAMGPMGAIASPGDDDASGSDDDTGDADDGY
jgi:copper(I)-binding protein